MTLPTRYSEEVQPAAQPARVGEESQDLKKLIGFFPQNEPRARGRPPAELNEEGQNIPQSKYSK